MQYWVLVVTDDTGQAYVHGSVHVNHLQHQTEEKLVRLAYLHENIQLSIDLGIC